MKKLKRMAAMLMAACMMAGMLAGCGSDTSESAGTQAQTTAAAEGDSQEAASESGETYKIGMYQVMSGANAIYGEEALNALNMAVEKMNAEGGLNGVPVEVVVYDDQGSPEEAVKAVTKLIDVDQVDACISSCISSCILATAGALNDAEIITFGTGLSPTYMEQGWEYVFRACVNSDYTAPQTVDLAKKLDIQTVAIFRGQDESAIATADTFSEECEAQGIQVVTEEAYNDGDSDFSGQITKIMNSGADAVFMSTVGATYGMFIKQLRQYGFEGIILNKEALPTDAVEVAADAADYVAFAAPYLTYASLDECDDESIRSFLEEYQEEFGALPATDCAFRVYDSLLVLWEGAKRAGSNDASAVKDAINQISDLQGLCGTLDFTDGSREGIHSFKQFIRVNGANMLLDDWMASDAYQEWKQNRNTD